VCLQVATSGLNTGQCIIPLVSSWLFDINGSSYIPAVEVFYIGLGTFGFVVGCCLNYMDYKQGGNLNSRG
jgi:hypothetical protein